MTISRFTWEYAAYVVTLTACRSHNCLVMLRLAGDLALLDGGRPVVGLKSWDY